MRYRIMVVAAFVFAIVVGFASTAIAENARSGPRPAAVTAAQYDREIKMGNALYANYVERFVNTASASAWYAEAERQEQERAEAAWLRSQATRKPVAPNAQRLSAAPVSGAAPIVTGACGGATNGADAYIGRESGGNANARNASGAWGCYQIMPATWQGSCSDLGTHGSAGTEAQARCASRLPSSAWAASGG